MTTIKVVSMLKKKTAFNVVYVYKVNFNLVRRKGHNMANMFMNVSKQACCYTNAWFGIFYFHDTGMYLLSQILL